MRVRGQSNHNIHFHEYLKVCHVLPDAVPPRGGHGVPGPLLPLPLLRHDARHREADGGPREGSLHQEGDPLPGKLYYTLGRKEIESLQSFVNC